MFTGIIEEIGRVAGVKSSGDNILIEITAPLISSDIALGKSIAVNGACLTAVAFCAGEFTVEATKATLASTNLGLLTRGSAVNLERAMRADGRFDGHFVQGHVDGTGRIRSLSKNSSAAAIEIAVADELVAYMVHKGSVAVNGVSLTIMELKPDAIVLNIIPHTLKETTLISLKEGDIVNIETDMLAKYALKAKGNKKEIDEKFLKEKGFLL